MKTTFSRAVSAAAAVLLAGFLLVGLGFQVLANLYLRQRTLDRLRENAVTVSDLAEVYYENGTILNQSLRLNMALVAQATDIDAVICDRRGQVILCSESPMGCDHLGKVIDGDYFEKLLRSRETSDVGLIRGLYQDNRYVVGVPIRSGDNAAGAVIVSAPVAENMAVLHRLLRLYLLAALFVIAVCILATILLTRRQSNPIRAVARAARAFGHGDLDARVPVDPHSPEEVRELAAAFNNMADSIRSGQQQQREFIANVSHELKTPMTSVSGYVDGILDGTIPPEKHREYMLLVSEETKRLSRLVRSMLDISREQAQITEDQKQLFDICECMGQVLFAFEHTIGQKGLNVETELPDHPVYTRAAQDAITRVLYNLVDNAVKFAAHTMGVRVRDQGGKLYITVYNDGQTIPPEELPLLFERFHQLDKSHSADGWGLGLAIVKNIIGRHGEEISVVSRDGETAFTFTLPQIN